MSSSQHPPSKLSKKPKISVRPVWIKKMSTCHPSNEFDTPTPMPKPLSPCNEPSKENSPIAQSNQASPQPYSPINLASPQPYSPPLSDPCVTRVSQAQIPPQSVNQTQFTQPSFPYSPPLINPYVASVLQAQSSPSPQGDNQTQPPSPPSPSREMLVDEINQLQDLSNLLAMHLLN
ncbi:hypothetical protein Tco_0773652 [Tanacetum coccineum]|uniref:Uncharacterized protein n=1 Tax=Tanacetum coccineum TaxID=301880 RepID=A0ABQ4ZNK6_9ASTR